MSTDILLWEPQCWGVEHARANAAVLATFLAAFPDSAIAFMGEKTHLDWIRQTLDFYWSSGVDRIEWIPVSIPKRSSSGWRRIPGEFSCALKVLIKAKKHEPGVFVACSLTGPGLFSLKCLIQLIQFHFPILAIPHSVLATLKQACPRKPWSQIIHFPRALKMLKNSRIRYIALGEPILQTLQKEFPRLAVHFSSMDLPNFMPPYGADENKVNPSLRMHFGFLGIASRERGFDEFVRLAERVYEEYVDVRFSLVGCVKETEVHFWRDAKVEGLRSDPLSQKEYYAKGTALTYLIWTAVPAHYQLVASASFLDALALGKPGIYLRNPYVEFYFKEMGDIGFLCDSLQEMEKKVLEISSNFPAERYKEQCAAIERGRQRFSPEHLASRIREIIAVLHRAEKERR